MQEGNDIAIIDMCNGQLQETRPQLIVKNIGEEGSRVRILESHQGKKVTVGIWTFYHCVFVSFVLE